MKQKVFKQKMYGFVMYQLGGSIHAGIQFGHAKDAYSIICGKTKEYIRWLHHDKAYVILNGGTTNYFIGGGLQKRIKELEQFNIKYALFHEEDMDNILTSIAFLVDERVYEKSEYPDVEEINKIYLTDTESFSNKEEYKKLIEQAKILEKNGIFEKRKWLFSFPLSK